ncbi:MAG: 3-keto-disaccharide hydrolase [Coraliomargaritaceae bacterium]
MSSAVAGVFSGDPPNATHPWAVHDQNRPQPPVIVAGKNPGDPPSDAVILFDGTESSLQNWKHAKPKDERKEDWSVDDGALLCSPGAGYLQSVEAFGDCQLHLEWSAPVEIKGSGQGRGNSGVFLMGMVEVQILDNYENPTYVDGMAGSIYGVMPPAVNALRPPGEWQSYDIIFRRPIVREGKLLDAGSITVLCNGVLIQQVQNLEGGGGHRKRKNLNRFFPEKGPLLLQDHGNPVRFRNIWVRSLRPRALEGGLDGPLDPEVSLIKRAGIAQDIRKDAAQMSGLDRALRLYESLLYTSDAAALKAADEIALDYLKRINQGTKDELKSHKNMVLRLHKAFQYLADFELLPGSHFALPVLESIMAEQGWGKKK